MALLPLGSEDAAFYRILSAGETIAELKGWTISTAVSTPANGVFFAQGESPVVTVTILDSFAGATTKDSFSTLNLYMYGPEDPQQTVTAVKLLNATTNRAARPHHYIDLKTNPNAQIVGNTITYPLRAVTDEAPGTYTISLWAALGTDNIQQVMRFSTVQIKTNAIENTVITKAKCAACHEGAISGKIYMHHIDPGYSPTGSWSLDYQPDHSCKSCHNNDGYAAFTDPAGLSVGVTNLVPDHIVKRVHGVHMGEELQNLWNTNSTNGVFKNYTEMEFVAGIRNCTTCHVDDRWKTKPSRLACGACHDNTWFGATAQTPAGMTNHVVPMSDDVGCSLCHPADGVVTPPLTYPVAAVHLTPRPSTNDIDITMTPPANGKYYVAGERPVVSLVFKKDDGTSIGDHNLVTTTNFSTARLFVYGPRSHAMPVLTSIAKLGIETARASVTCATNGPWAISNKVFRIAINGSTPQDITFTSPSNTLTAAQVVAQLNAILPTLNGGATATVSSSTKVMIKSLIRGANARIEIYNGEVTTAMGWKAKGVVIDPDVFVAAVSTPGNDLRPITADPLDYNDPLVTRTTTNIMYQLDDVAGLAAGTYGIYAYYLPVAGKIVGLTNLTGFKQVNFQIGTATAEKKIATRCADCHGETIWHLYEGPIHAEKFDTDACNACHDYSHPNTGDMFKNQGGTSVNGWSGYGAMPIVNRVHGVHRGAYLEHPEQIYANATKDTFGHIIFPQDVRNCTKCHAETTTWKEKPTRMACLACHDTDAARTHGLLMTYIPDVKDPYGPSAQESCEVCHGKNKEFSPDKVHSITNPYVPPYPRE
jgi:hypothetical protein